MEVAGLLSGGAPILKKYQSAQTVSNIGTPLLVADAAEAGLDESATTTPFVDLVGLNLDTATYVTAQQTDGTSAERTVTVVINPDAILRARLSGGATSGTALTRYTVLTATTDGLDVTGSGVNFASPQFDEGSVWFYDGRNSKQIRRITATSSAVITVAVAFEGDHQAGDDFLIAPYSMVPTDAQTMQITADFTEADAAIAVGTGGAINILGIDAQDLAGDGTLTSSVTFTTPDHYMHQ